MPYQKSDALLEQELKTGPELRDIGIDRLLKVYEDSLAAARPEGPTPIPRLSDKQRRELRKQIETRFEKLP